MQLSRSTLSFDQRNLTHRIISDWDGSMGIKHDNDPMSVQKKQKNRSRFLWRSPRA